MPETGEDDVWVAGLQFQIGGTGQIGEKENLFPGFAAIGGAVDAAFFRGRKGIALRGDEDDIGVGGVDADGGDLAHVAEADETPGLSGVGGLVEAAPDRDIGADLRGAGAGVNDFGAGEGDVDGPHGAGRNLAIGDVTPGVAGVDGFPDSAACRAHVIREGIRGDAGDGGDPAASVGADGTVAEGRIERLRLRPGRDGKQGQSAKAN